MYSGRAAPDNSSAPYGNPGHVFEGTAAYYAASRPGYPDHLIDHLARLAAQFPAGRVLDLGCGPGAVAIALALRGMDVLAVDPSVEMLEEGRRQAERSGVHGIQWLEGSSYTLPALQDICLVTIGDAFHWMIPRAETLESLDDLVVAGGAVALLSHRWEGYPKPSWERVLRQVRERHVGTRHRAGNTGEDSRVEPGTHTDIFSSSPFCRLTKITVDYELSVTLDQVVNWQFSHAQTSLPALGDQREAYEEDLRTALREWRPSGEFREPSQAHLLIGERSAKAPPESW
jgi:SAM-dependent methyltransferase